MRIPLFVAATLSLCLLLAGPVAAQESGNSFTSSAYGFRLTKPADDWKFHEAESDPMAKYSVSVVPPTGGGMVAVTFRVNPAATGATPESLREAIRGYAEGRPEFANVNSREVEAAGRTAAVLEIDQTASGTTYRVQQVYFVVGDYSYTFQAHAPVPQFTKHAASFSEVLSSLEFIEVDHSNDPDYEIKQIAKLAGTELDWQATWEAAAAQAREQNKLVLVHVRLYAGFAISDESMAGPFMDEDLVKMIDAHCIPLRWQRGMDAPFTAQEEWGMGPTTFGAAELIVTPEGKVLREVFGSEVATLDQMLRETFAAHGNKATPPVSLDGALATSQWHYDRGELDDVFSVLKGAESAGAHLMRAKAHRRLRDAEAALASLAEAESADDGALQNEIEMTRARVLMRAGRYAEAASLFEGNHEVHLGTPWTPEAMYWHGAIMLEQDDVAGAEAIWRKLVKEQPTNRWGWKAAAILQSTAFQLEAGERLNWPDEDVIATHRPPELEPLPPTRARRAQADAIEYLIDNQRADGSWIVPSEVESSNEELASVFTPAVTAICAESLLPFRKQSEARKAIEMAQGYLDTKIALWMAMEEEIPAYFMDYTPWTDAYLLRLYSGLIEHEIGDEAAHLRIMAHVIDDLGTRAKAGGGWSYYLSGDLDNADSPANQSIVFTTAMVTNGLQRAKKAGADVPDEMLAGALRTLQAARNTNDTFEYFVWHDREMPRNLSEPGAAGRGPVCMLPLVRAGKATRSDLMSVLDLWMKHRKGLSKERGKALMHAGADAQGSHYVTFDYATVAEAIAALPERSRNKYKAALLEEMLEGRAIDGSYLDNPMIGPALGTGMVLMAFQDIAPLP